MPLRSSRRPLPAAEAETIVLQGQQSTPATVPLAAGDSDSDGDVISTTYTSTFMIPQASGNPIPSFTMLQPAGQVQPEPTQPRPTPSGVHTLSAETINEMVNSAVTRALPRATSAQNLTTPQTEPLPRQLLPTFLPPPLIPIAGAFAAITGHHGQPDVGQAGFQTPGMGYGWDTSGGGQFSFPGILLPPITDPKIISLQALLPEVDLRVTKKVLDYNFLPTDVLLLVPLESWNKAKGLLRDDCLDMANIAKDHRDFSILHLAPAIYNYAAIVIYFAPEGSKGPLAAAFATYISRLMSWAERYFFRAILQYHIHFHACVISQQGVYRAEAWAVEAPHLIGSYITPNVRPITFESRKRHHGDSGGSRMAGEATEGQKGRGGGRCWNWNSGRPCVREPCGFTQTCLVEGCTRLHKAIDDRLDRK